MVDCHQVKSNLVTREMQNLFLGCVDAKSVYVPPNMPHPIKSVLHHLRLNILLGAAFLNKIGVVDTPLSQSCCEAEDTAHILVSCAHFSTSRELLNMALRWPDAQPLDVENPN